MNAEPDRHEETPPEIGSPPRRESRRRTRWGAAAFGLAILASGVVIGAAGSAVITRKLVLQRLRQPARLSDRFVGSMKEQLDLSPGQEAQVHEIVARHTEAMHAIREETLPRIRAESCAMEEELAAVLSEEQAARLDRWFERFERFTSPGGRRGDARRRGRRSGPPGPEDPTKDESWDSRRPHSGDREPGSP